MKSGPLFTLGKKIFRLGEVGGVSPEFSRLSRLAQTPCHRRSFLKSNAHRIVRDACSPQAIYVCPAARSLLDPPPLSSELFTFEFGHCRSKVGNPWKPICWKPTKSRLAESVGSAAFNQSLVETVFAVSVAVGDPAGSVQDLWVRLPTQLWVSTRRWSSATK
jgi:hypothetical protein